MAETTYSYNLANDFPGGKVNLTALDKEVDASAITIAARSFSLGAGVVDVVFATALPAADKTVLDGDVSGPAGGLIAAHDNSSTAQSATLVEADEGQSALSRVDGTPEEGFKMTLVASQTHHELDISFPYKVVILKAIKETDAPSMADNDLICAFGMPGDQGAGVGYVGTVDSVSPAAQAIAYLADSVIALLGIGYEIQLGTEQKWYRVKSIDASGSVTLTENLTVQKDVADAVYMRKPIVLNRSFATGLKQVFGTGTAGGESLDAGNIMRITMDMQTAPTANEEQYFTLVYRVGI